MEIVKKLESQESLPIFCRESFLKSRSDDYGWFVEDDKILPFIIDKRLIFKRLIFTNSIYSEKAYDLKEEKEFLNKAITFAKKLKVDFISKPQANVFFNVLPKNVIGVEWGSFILDIKFDDDLILQKFKSRTRTKVRKAKKNNVVVKQDEKEDVYNIIKQTFERQGEGILAPSKSYINTLIENNKENILILSAYYKNQIQGGIIILYDSKEAHYYYGGSIQRPFDGSLFLLHYKAMQLLRDNGVGIYDLMGARTSIKKGSKVHGIQRFKLQFGSVLEQGYVFKAVFNPIKYKLFDFLVAVAYRLKGGRYEGDPIDQILKENKNVE